MTGPVEILGLVAGFCTTAAFAPQVLRTWRSRSTSDVSLAMYAIILLGTLLWLAYGVLTHDLPIILANSATAVLQASVLFLKLRHG